MVLSITSSDTGMHGLYHAGNDESGLSWWVLISKGGFDFLFVGLQIGP